MRQALPPFILGVGVALVICTVLSWSGGGFSLFTVVVTTPDVPITQSERALNRDAVYIGSMAFAGLALFSSVQMVRVHGLGKSVPKNRRIAAFVGLLGAFGLSTVQFGFASRMCCEDPGPLVWDFVVLSFGLALLAGSSYLYLELTDTSSTPGHN